LKAQLGATEAPAERFRTSIVSILPRPGRALVAIAVTGLSIGLSAGPATAASTSKSKTAASSKAKATSKAKSKTKKKAKVKVKAPAKADLTLKGIHVDVTADGTLLVSANLLNIGRGFAAPSNVAIALSGDKSLSNDDELLDTVEFDRIGAGTTRRVDAEVDVPFDIDTSEDLRVIVCADGGGVIAERSESNNCVWQTITLDELAPIDDAEPADESEDEFDDGAIGSGSGGDVADEVE
jgi:CARDB